MSTKKKPETLIAPVILGMSDDDAADIELMGQIQEAEKAATANPIPAAKKKFILKEIHVDSKTILCRRVELTPSMCKARGCSYDAALQFPDKGYKGWNDVPEDLTLRDGRTLRQAVMDVLQSHMDTKHGFEESHIMTEDEVRQRKQEAMVPGYFLTNARA
jgi:hypothetical protein